MRYKLVEKFFIKLKGSSVPGGGGQGQGGRVPPPKKETSDREISIDLSGKDKEKKENWVKK